MLLLINRIFIVLKVWLAMFVMVRKAVVTAGGLGTRLLPATKETPKEMLPFFAFNAGGSIYLKPVVQIVFESLYEVGFRDFCFVVGRGKRAVEDHFTPDYQFVHLLEKKRLKHQVEELNRFYRMIVDSKILFVNQPEPRGFGDAVLRAESFVGSEASIFDRLGETKPDKKGKMQLSDAIKVALDGGEKVFAVKLRKDEKYLDVGKRKIELIEKGVFTH